MIYINNGKNISSSLSIEYKNIYDSNIMNHLKELNQLYFDQMYAGNKVAYYYEDMNTGAVFSFNKNTCFYAASTIKMLVCLMLFEEASYNKIDLSQSLLIKMEDIRQGSGVLKNQVNDTYYTILELICECIIESDNTAYSALIRFVGKEKVKEYGQSLGAIHTMEGKETDLFGIINCHDMIIYWKKIKDFIDNNLEYGKIFRDYLLNTTTKLIHHDSIKNGLFLRKYGSFGLAYHEAGYIECENPYYLIILTQLNEKEYKDSFINESASKVKELHSLISRNKY